MAGTGRKWLVGCGIGCGLIILMTVGIGTVGYFGVKKFVDRAENLEASMEQMDAEYGSPSDFVPRVDGSIPSDRMAVFLAVREQMTPVRTEVSDIFLTLDGQNDAGVIDKVKAGVKFLPSLLVFIEERNRTMMEQGMGVGEYQYIYALAYYGLLGVDPSDGPGFSVTSDDEAEEQGFQWQGNIGDEKPEKVREERERDLRRLVNRVQARVLANQLEALDADVSALGDLDRETWREQLAAEAAAMDRESLRLLWEEGMPEQIRASLEPYRSQLEGTYDPMTSILEMGLVNQD